MILISILAGIELSSLRARFPTPRTIVKAMPNTPAKLGKGVTNLFTDSEDGQAIALVEGLMAALGTVERFDEEALFQIAGILSGRSEERRVGKEGGSTCKSRGAPYTEKKKIEKKNGAISK